MNLFQPTHLVLVLLVVVLLFGSSKIPSLMRSLGSGMNEFKKGLAEGAEEKTPKT
jgi:sec-independent protein translocase protein TatA